MSLLNFLLFSILSERAVLIERAIGLLLALSGIFVPELRIIFLTLAAVCFLFSIAKLWIGNHVSVELDSSSSIIRIIDESDHEPVSINDEIFKTQGHMKVHLFLKFTNETLNDVLINDDTEGKLFRSLAFGRKRQIGGWIHLANKKQIIIPANSVSPPYLFKWVMQLPSGFKYETTDFQYFFRVRLNILRRVSIQKDFSIRWAELRTGRFNPA